MRTTSRSSARAGFTLIELLVVIGAIAAIAALTMPALNHAKRQARVAKCDALVKSVAAAIAIYPRRDIAVPARGEPGLRDGEMRRLWDFDAAHDRLIDGDPQRDPAFTDVDRRAAANVGYGGFLAATGIAVATGDVDASDRIVDPWRRPLHIAFATDVYGASWFGVWSDGPDGVEGDDDDVRSWK